VVESRCPGFEPGDCVPTVPYAADGRWLAEFPAIPGSACVRLPAAAPVPHSSHRCVRSRGIASLRG
jgi:hypothetical protein